jgi:hypothetical protein
MRLNASADFWTAVQWLRKWSVVHLDHNVASFLAILVSFFDDWRGTPEEAASLQLGGLGSIVLDLRGLYQKRANDLGDSAWKAGAAGELLAMAGFHARSLALRAVVHLCDATRRIVRSRTWSPLISDAWELAVDDLVTMAAIDMALVRLRENEDAWSKSTDAAPADIDPGHLGLFCGGLTRNQDVEQMTFGTRDQAIALFFAVVEEHRIAGDAARVCWKDGCLARVARGALGCEEHPFLTVAREAEPTVRLAFVSKYATSPIEEVPGISPKAIDVESLLPPLDRILASLTPKERAIVERRTSDVDDIGGTDWRKLRCQTFNGPAPHLGPGNHGRCICAVCVRARALRDAEDRAMLTLAGVEPCGPNLWWAHVELSTRGAMTPRQFHFRVVADSAGGAVMLAQSIESLEASFVVNALRDRPFTVLTPDDVRAILMLAAKEGSK